jgi:hypothetical protein
MTLQTIRAEEQERREQRQQDALARTSDAQYWDDNLKRYVEPVEREQQWISRNVANRKLRRKVTSGARGKSIGVTCALYVSQRIKNKCKARRRDIREKGGQA